MRSKHASASLDAAAAEQGIAAIVECVDVARRDRERLVEARERIVAALERVEHEAVIGQRVGRCGLTFSAAEMS